MLGIDKPALKAVWTVFLFGLILFVLYKIAHTLIVFALAIFLAHLLAPLVTLVERLVPQRGRRGLALAIVYLAMAGIFLGIAIPLGSAIGQQAVLFANKLPDALKSNPLQRIPLPALLEPRRESLGQFLSDRLQEIGGSIVPTLSHAGRQIVTGLGNVLYVILIPILSFLFLVSGEELRRMFVNLFSTSARPTVDGIMEDLHYLLSHYIRALILLACATFVAFSIFLAIIGAPYAVLLAGCAALLEVIPVVGPLTAAVSIVIIAALSGFGHVLYIVIFLAAYRVFQDYVLSPYLMGTGVEVPPLLVLFGVLAGDQIAGVPGMFFSVPLIAALKMIFVRLRKAHVG